MAETLTDSDETEIQMYNDLKAFLTSNRTDLRKSATEAVLSVRERVAMAKVVQHGLVEALAKNVNYPSHGVANNSLQALVQLSSQGASANQCVQDLLQAGGLGRLMEIVLSSPLPENDAEDDRRYSEWQTRVNFAMALLANLTRTEAGAVDLVGRTLPEEAVASKDLQGRLPHKPTMELLLARFLNPQYVEVIDYSRFEQEPETTTLTLDSTSKDPFQHFAAVLMNAAQTEAGRSFLLKLHYKNKGDQGSAVLQALLPQLRSPNPIRRRGIAGTIRNCCIDKDSIWWLLNVANIVTPILYPFAGPEDLDVEEKQGLDPDLWLEGPDKQREPDHLTRLFLVEAIRMLCSGGRLARQKLRVDRAYVILKWADMVEEHEDVSEHINECVQLLRRDEEGTKEGSSDGMVKETYHKPYAAHRVGAGADNFDDVD